MILGAGLCYNAKKAVADRRFVSSENGKEIILPIAVCGSVWMGRYGCILAALCAEKENFPITAWPFLPYAV